MAKGSVGLFILRVICPPHQLDGMICTVYGKVLILGGLSHHCIRFRIKREKIALCVGLEIPFFFTANKK